MAIPKKRKPIDPSGTPIKKRSNPRKKINAKPVTQPDPKLDQAFEIVERIGASKEQKPGDPEPQSETRQIYKKMRKGFQWHISLDAVMPEDRSESGSKPDVETASLFDIAFTVPFFWTFPIVGNMTLKYLKFLNSLKNRKNT